MGLVYQRFHIGHLTEFSSKSGLFIFSDTQDVWYALFQLLRRVRSYMSEICVIRPTSTCLKHLCIS